VEVDCLFRGSTTYFYFTVKCAANSTSDLTVLKGIYPGLRKVLEEQINAFNAKLEGEDVFMTVHETPEALHDPQKHTVDPFGNDFFCALCHKELGNAYMHCDGCEFLLQKDFNICTACHSIKERREKNIQMHPFR